MSAIINHIDRLSEGIGQVASWLALAMVAMTFFNVIQRYFFASGLPWEQEIVRFMHAILFLATAAYTLKHDAHVRVDVLYQHLSQRGKAWVNLLGTLFLLFPLCIAIICFSWSYVLSSWELLESSSEFRGMPGVFILKSFIWFFAASLALQGAAMLLDAWHIIKPGNAQEKHG